tara:strand:+ start:404 stop:541 length:138 start_codon:yes stop_codon:yes gene_type:complete
MWVDDCVHIAVVEAMALRDIMNEAEEIDNEDLEAAADYFDNLTTS